MNKTCGECIYFIVDDGYRYCDFFGENKSINDGGCVYFTSVKKPTKGDAIRQMSNEGLAAFVCGVLNDRREETFRSVLDSLNAPAESEGGNEC